ncbi:MAG TPA: hypothetical protein VHL58_06565 [Thermoanaerobaculia bacterium]|nr:hypothetical protein [Thermoanaerobaculia bacterium]
MPKPITETEMIVLLNEEIARLDNLTRPAWKQYRKPLAAVPCEKEGFDRKELFAVARAENEVVVYDDATSRFASGFLDEDGVLRKWSTYGEEMRSALKHFPHKRS